MRERGVWLFQSREAAEREYDALKIAFDSGVSVPRPLAQNRHSIAMGIIEGAELAECLELKGPETFLQEILLNLRKAYREARIVNGDLSEFNVIFKPEGALLIIDWPQYVTTDHPDAERLLHRDVRNLLKYFSRKFRVKQPLEGALGYVKGERYMSNSDIVRYRLR